MNKIREFLNKLSYRYEMSSNDVLAICSFCNAKVKGQSKDIEHSADCQLREVLAEIDRKEILIEQLYETLKDASDILIPDGDPYGFREVGIYNKINTALDAVKGK